MIGGNSLNKAAYIYLKSIEKGHDPEIIIFNRDIYVFIKDKKIAISFDWKKKHKSFY